MSSALEIVAAKHLIDKGLPVNAAVALTCVLYYESKLISGSQGNQPTERGGVLNLHGAYGIASWNGPRQQDLSDYAMKRGAPVELLETQLDFVLNEIANHYPRSWEIIRSSATVSAVIAVVVDEYENPKDKAKEISGAFAFASSLLAAVKDYVPVVVVAPPILPVPLPSVPPVPPIGASTMPVEAILQLVAPLAEALVAGLIKGALAHAQPGATGTPAPAHSSGLTAGDFAAIAQLIASELAKLNPPKAA
jgi:hypothetical protein